jgi:hypothetical protein
MVFMLTYKNVGKTESDFFEKAALTGSLFFSV